MPPVVNLINKAATGGSGATYNTNWAALPGGPGDFATNAGRPGGVAQPAAAAPAAAPPPDPYAAWGGQARYNSLVSGFNTQDQAIHNTAGESASNAGIGLGGDIRTLVYNLQKSQNNINNQGTQAELAKRTGTQDILGMVGRGIKSSGVMLANRNAGSSSAVDALARAYGELGRNNLSKVGNQYASAQDSIKQAQDDWQAQMQLGTQGARDKKTQTINDIVNQAHSQLASLDAQIASNSLPGRINIEAEKNAVRQDALNRLQGLDAQLSQGVGSIHASTVDERRAKAADMSLQGVAPDTAFQYQSQAPAQFQDTGPFASNLPLFTLPKKQQGA